MFYPIPGILCELFIINCGFYIEELLVGFNLALDILGFISNEIAPLFE